MFFDCSAEGVAYLQSRDPVLGAAIAAIGPIRREIEPDLFTCTVQQITGQQISGRALATVWQRLRTALPGQTVTPEGICALGEQGVQACGMSWRKAACIVNFARQVQQGSLDLKALSALDDELFVERITALPGIGEWTAQMLLIFCLQRPDVLSFKDLGIQRGMRMLYRHRRITPQLFATYRRRCSPWGSIASLYLWEVAGGALPELNDPASDRGRTENSRSRRRQS